MPLVSLRNLSFGFTSPPLLDGIDLEIEPGERIGLLGRNGAGKSTLMKLIAGEIEPDHGQVIAAPGTKIARLMQEVPGREAGSVAELVASGWDPEGAPAEEHSWRREQAVKRVLSKMSLDGELVFATLSSGMKRRALLAQALVCEPQLLLLDEPTNHLDIEAIAWLERFLKGYDGALVFVTHDRVFLQSLATRILEIDRGRLFDWSCDYQTFLKRKAAAMEAEEKQQAQFDKHLAQEEAWIRQGIKARRTRNEGRVKALKKLRVERQQRRSRVGNVHLRAVEAEKSGLLVIEAEDVSFTHPDGPQIAKGFSTLLTRGEKVGIVGPNGSGKTTLLKLLLGDLEPDAGTIRHGTRLQVVYFDQLREQLDEEESVLDNVAEGQQTITIGGKQKHIYGYLQDFLFTPERARQPVKFLSGGERNRLLLARLFKRPSNVMVLDEPTNDLDAETLELLEELVSDYSGTLLLVSHDRAFLNNVVTSTLVLEGAGQVKAYDGGYDDYVRQRDAAAEAAEPATAEKPRSKGKPKPKPASGPAKLNFNETRELAALPQQIEQLETQQSELHEAMADPSFYQQDGTAISSATAELEQLQQKLTELYARWEELEARA